MQQSDEDMKKSLKKRHEIIDHAKKEEREAIENQYQLEQERFRRQASASGDFSGAGSNTMAAASSAAPAANGTYPRKTGYGMNRRTQSSTGEPFFSRRESTEAVAAAGRGGRASGEVVSNGNGRQPRAFEQLRQACVEDTLTDFFGL